MKKRIFWSILFSSFLTLILASVLLTAALYGNFSAEKKRDLAAECGYIAAAYENSDIAWLAETGRESDMRITLVAPDGTVLYDSFAYINTLDNHLGREEVAEALLNGTGEATRMSDSLGEKTYYYALRLGDGSVLRVSQTVKNLFGIISGAFLPVMLIVLMTVAGAAVTAHFLTKSVVSPVNSLDLDHPLSNNTYGELSPLLLRMDRQNKKITEQFEALEQKRNELGNIADSMKEALVLFGSGRHVLFSNKSADELFGIKSEKNPGYLELCRDISYVRAAEAAFAGSPASEKITRNGRIFQLTVNPVRDNKNYAAVLFASDITEKEQNDRMRREFSANVSHELKTPLTSILGCAEIMQNGIAKPEDFPRFIGQIHAEARRLISLIDDIIKLSRLDEDGLKKEFAPVDLYALSEKVIASLADKAAAAGVSLTLEGETAFVEGLAPTLYEMVANLCDNAVKYNKPGGSVTVSITGSGPSVRLSVRDTGIGIAPEHQSRVFERFYRVDKSRSKETGGTGLGLSIVKHGAMLHGAAIKLESNPGTGTLVTLLFNKS